MARRCTAFNGFGLDEIVVIDDESRWRRFTCRKAERLLHSNVVKL